MMYWRILTILTLLPLVAACGNITEIGKEPPMTPVGAGLAPDKVPIMAVNAPRPVYRPGNSLWQDTSADLFRDPRAAKIGDVITVKISIKDKASFDTKNDRSRKSKSSLDSSFSYGINLAAKSQHLQAQGVGAFNPKVDAQTETKAAGTIERSESIDLLIAAVVTGVLPNGNLIISGTQEVRVNYEVRVLNIAGMVRPRDISTDNAISYDKIAEARISYGGRGRVTEIQQPGWGQQIVDGLIAPW
jgi:flagellar L-ring protein FlgH